MTATNDNPAMGMGLFLQKKMKEAGIKVDPNKTLTLEGFYSRLSSLIKLGWSAKVKSNGHIRLRMPGVIGETSFIFCPITALAYLDTQKMCGIESASQVIGLRGATYQNCAFAADRLYSEPHLSEIRRRILEALGLKDIRWYRLVSWCHTKIQTRHK